MKKNYCELCKREVGVKTGHAGWWFFFSILFLPVIPLSIILFIISLSKMGKRYCGICGHRINKRNYLQKISSSLF